MTTPARPGGQHTPIDTPAAATASTHSDNQPDVRDSHMTPVAKVSDASNERRGATLTEEHTATVGGAKRRRSGGTQQEDTNGRRDDDSDDGNEAPRRRRRAEATGDAPNGHATDVTTLMNSAMRGAP